MQQTFKVQLIQISDKIIKDKKTGQDVIFKVLKFLEYNDKTGVPTGELQDKYLRSDSELLKSINFKFGSFYFVDLNFSGKITDICEYSVASKK